MHRLVALCALLPAAGAAAQGLGRHAERHLAASQTDLARRWGAVGSTTVHRLRSLNGKGARPYELLTPEGGFIIRRPSRGVEPALGRNRGLRRLAALFGAPELVPAAIPGTTPFPIGDLAVGHEVMVMDWVPAEFRDGADPTGRSWFPAVPEGRRILGAAIDLLTEFGDRTPANLMLRRDGALRLIDGDSAFGAWRDRPQVHASAFFPGLTLGYGSLQDRFEALPHDLRQGIERLSESVDADLAGTLQIEREQALLPIHYARRVRRLGLTGAIDEYLGSVRLAPPR